MSAQTLVYIVLGIFSSIPVITIILTVARWKRFDNDGFEIIERFLWCAACACMIAFVLCLTVLPICTWVVLATQ